jgi:hypothetical protein
MTTLSRKISDLTVNEFSELISGIIDARIQAIFSEEGELKDEFISELLERKNNPKLVGFKSIF